MRAQIECQDLKLGYDRHPAVHHARGAIAQGAPPAVGGPQEVRKRPSSAGEAATHATLVVQGTASRGGPTGGYAGAVRSLQMFSDCFTSLR